jgi:hypothetical protein
MSGSGIKGPEETRPQRTGVSPTGRSVLSLLRGTKQEPWAKEEPSGFQVCTSVSLRTFWF